MTSLSNNKMYSEATVQFVNDCHEFHMAEAIVVAHLLRQMGSVKWVRDITGTYGGVHHIVEWTDNCDGTWDRFEDTTKYRFYDTYNNHGERIDGWCKAWHNE